MFVPPSSFLPTRRVWGLAFSASGEADTFAFSLQGALEALQLDEARKRRRREEEQFMIKEEMAVEAGVNEEKIRTRDDGEGGWSPRRERWEAGTELQERLAGAVQKM